MEGESIIAAINNLSNNFNLGFSMHSASARVALLPSVVLGARKINKEARVGTRPLGLLAKLCADVSSRRTAQQVFNGKSRPLNPSALLLAKVWPWPTGRMRNGVRGGGRRRPRHHLSTHCCCSL